MAAMNDVTGDSLISKGLSPQGEQNFDQIFGKRDFRNRPILQEPQPEREGTEQRPLARHSDSVYCGEHYY